VTRHLIWLRIDDRHGWSYQFGRQISHVDVALYEPDATAGAMPVVVIPVQRDAPVDRLQRGGTIVGRGIAAPGHAMVLVVDDTTVPCAGPAWLPTLFRTRLRL
jgi:hypothetical protein